MKIKHSKYKNTGIIYELLVRQITSDILNKREPKSLPLIEKYFAKTELGKEYKLYELISNKNSLTEGKAESLINSILETSKRLNRKKLKSLKYNLISEIKQHYNIDNFFKSNLENYKQYASLYTLIEATTSPDNIDINQLVNNKLTLIEHFTKGEINKEETKKGLLEEYNSFEPDLKALTYKILVEKFNQKYNNLSKDQKQILQEYINNAANTESLRKIVVSKYKAVKESIQNKIEKLEDPVLKIKIQEVHSLIPTICEKRKISDNDISSLLQLLELNKELDNG